MNSTCSKDKFYGSDFMAENRNIAFYAGAIYIVTIFGLKRYMRDRKPLNLNFSLFLWNLGLGIGSILGFTSMVSGLVTLIAQPGGLYRSICVQEELDEPFKFWGLMFTISKYVELGDTLFIVLRKRPLIFLQWYHHLITLWAVWITVPFGEPILRWIAVMNLGIHSLMYPYFAIRACGKQLPTPCVNLITTLQLVQMLGGFLINISSWYFHAIGTGCVRYPLSINLFMVLYGSFILLFGKLFYDSVIKGGRRVTEKQN